MATAKELITYAADMFRKNPERWGRGTLAQDKHGSAVGVDKVEACKFCLIGGLQYADHVIGGASGQLCQHASGALRSLLIEKTGDRSLWYWNDQPSRKVEEVVNLLDEAAARIKG